MHQAPTWHTPTTEPLKTPIQPSHIFNLEQMLSERPFPRHSPGVDLSVTRNGSQNGDIPAAPISLSVRDTNKINSLAASALEIQGNELKSLSPGLKSSSPGLKSASPSLAPEKSPKSTKKAKRVDSILERLNPQQAPVEPIEKPSPPLQQHHHHHHLQQQPQQLHHPEEKSVVAQSSVIVQASSSHDENSNSSSIRREDEVVSPYSNEDSLDSNKSRRKRKPSKTIRVPATAKEPEATEPPPKTVDLPPPVEEELERPVIAETPKDVENEKKIPERRKSESPVARKTRRKTSSESETIDKIAAMVQETAKKTETPPPTTTTTTTTTMMMMTTTTTTSSTATTTPTTDVVRKDFVEDKLQEMFAGLEDAEGPETVLSTNAAAAAGVVVTDDPKATNFDLNNLAITPSTSHDNVTSTSGDVTASGSKKRNQKKRKLSSGKRMDKKKKVPKRNLANKITEITPKKTNSKKVNGKAKIEVIKDVYAYDSGSNASSSKSRGPFVQIRGPRDSPLSVSVINTPVNEDESDRKGGSKSKKFHDDSEYRHKVRSKGLHCSTLSNKYDAQTKDATWICVFCKRGPYSNEFSRGVVGFYTPGDLFGPYVITSNCAEFERRLEDPYDKQFKSKKVCRTLDGLVSPKASTAAAGASTGTTKKKSRKVSENNEDVLGGGFGGGVGGGGGLGTGSDMLGITQMDEKSYEIWAHEDCVVWAPGIYLVGPKIVGLEEAVWTSSNVGCSRCHLKGANICCLRRGCPSVVHLGCAVLLNWQLDEDNYKAYCLEHRV